MNFDAISGNNAFNSTWSERSFLSQNGEHSLPSDLLFLSQQMAENEQREKIERTTRAVSHTFESANEAVHVDASFESRGVKRKLLSSSVGSVNESNVASDDGVKVDDAFKKRKIDSSPERLALSHLPTPICPPTPRKALICPPTPRKALICPPTPRKANTCPPTPVKARPCPPPTPAKGRPCPSAPRTERSSRGTERSSRGLDGFLIPSLPSRAQFRVPAPKENTVVQGIKELFEKVSNPSSENPFYINDVAVTLIPLSEKGSLLQPYDVIADEEVIKGIGNKNLLIKLYSIDADTSLSKLPTRLDASIESYKKIQSYNETVDVNDRIPLATWYNVDAAKTQLYFLVEKLPNKINLENANHIEQANKLLKIMFAKNILLDLSSANLRIKTVEGNEVVTLIDYPEKGEINFEKEQGKLGMFVIQFLKEWVRTTSLHYSDLDYDEKGEKVVELLKKLTDGLDAYESFKSQWTLDAIHAILLKISYNLTDLKISHNLTDIS